MINGDGVHHGNFRLQELDVWGELVFAGEDSRLQLKVQGHHPQICAPKVIHGRLHNFTYVTCVGCVGGEQPDLTLSSDGSSYSTWDVFPHQVLAGRSYFDPDKNHIKKVRFSTGDICRIFHDRDSFGVVRNPSESLHSVIPEKIGDREVPTGPNPQFVYFAGRDIPLSVSLSFGALEVQHWPFARSNAQGAGISTRMMIQLEFGPVLTLQECLRTVLRVGQFLDLVAGRSQGIESVEVELEGADSGELPLSLYWSLGPQQTGGQKLDEPSWIDMPLDGIRRAEEFGNVIAEWFESDAHSLARARLHSCRKNGNTFDVNRLVAAANMFDLTSAMSPVEIPKDLADVREECLIALKALPRSDERDSAIMALSRIGTPTLMKKVQSRVAVLRPHFVLKDLEKVLRQAIKCRNYFVHGPGDKSFNVSVAANHKAFLTETLEFVFAAAELIDCGWAAGAWRLRPHTGHHWFSRYLSEYEESSRDLLLALKRAAKSD